MPAAVRQPVGDPVGEARVFGQIRRSAILQHRPGRQLLAFFPVAHKGDSITAFKLPAAGGGADAAGGEATCRAPDDPAAERAAPAEEGTFKEARKSKPGEKSFSRTGASNLTRATQEGANLPCSLPWRWTRRTSMSEALSITGHTVSERPTRRSPTRAPGRAQQTSCIVQQESTI